jgi:hypothetical protein
MIYTPFLLFFLFFTIDVAYAVDPPKSQSSINVLDDSDEIVIINGVNDTSITITKKMVCKINVKLDEKVPREMFSFIVQIYKEKCPLFVPIMEDIPQKSNNNEYPA